MTLFCMIIYIFIRLQRYRLRKIIEFVDFCLVFEPLFLILSGVRVVRRRRLHILKEKKCLNAKKITTTKIEIKWQLF